MTGLTEIEAQSRASKSGSIALAIDEIGPVVKRLRWVSVHRLEMLEQTLQILLLHKLEAS